MGFGFCIDNFGTFYFSNNNGIYSFNPITKKIQYEIVKGIPTFSEIINPKIRVNNGVITSIALDNNNLLYFIYNTNQKEYKANLSTNVLTVIVGNSPIPYAFPFKDSIAANNLKLGDPATLCFDQNYDLLLADNNIGLL